MGQDPRPLSSGSVLNEVSVYIWELLTRGINSLKELAWAGKGFLNDLVQAYLPSTSRSRRHLTGYQHYVLRYEMLSLAVILTGLIKLKTSDLIIPDPEVEELLQQLANRAALPLQVMGVRFAKQYELL